MTEQWAELEFAPWSGFAIDKAALDRGLRAIAQATRSVFIFHVTDGAVSFEEKAQSGDPHIAVLAGRAQLYAEFLQDALTGFGVRGRGSLAFDMEDIGHTRFPMPVFAFQKRRGANTMLLPDIDMIDNEWFIDAGSVDPVPYEAKRPGAVFVGATTGNPMLTAAHVQGRRNQRLRSAVFFKDHPDVLFELPLIVQHDTPETLAMIEALGVKGRIRQWPEQCAWRYMLSLDGNGAACSRVYRSLLGNGVLVKYNSPYLLYYFHGLEPWVHYVPAIGDEDVLALLAEADRHQALHRAIAERSAAFARTWLSRPQMLRYAARLIHAYLARFGEEAGWPDAPRLMIDAHGHFAGSGDLWAACAGWLGDGRGPMEGFALVPGIEIAPDDLLYCAAGQEGVLSRPSSGHGFCGSRGEGRPLHGVQIMLKGEAALRYDLSYETRFLDGTESGPLPGGTLSLSAAPLTGLKLAVSPRG